jgi:hypothetical protein
MVSFYNQTAVIELDVRASLSLNGIDSLTPEVNARLTVCGKVQDNIM